jgi:hypothetical protein
MASNALRSILPSAFLGSADNSQPLRQFVVADGVRKDLVAFVLRHEIADFSLRSDTGSSMQPAPVQYPGVTVVGLTLRHRHAAIVDETGPAADACVSLR